MYFTLTAQGAESSYRAPATLGHFGRATLALLLLAAGAAAQTTNATDGTTPPGIAPGAPAGSYGLTGFENVNLYNGNLNFHLPLVRAGGRGGALAGSYLSIDSVRWTVNKTGGNDGTPQTPPSLRASWARRSARA